MNILVTGCGGDIGQSIGKILNESDLVANVYGMDITEKTAARFIYPNFSTGLRCSAPGYLDSLQQFILNNDIRLLLPVSEPELRFFSRIGVRHLGETTLVMASSEAMKIGFDKLLTAVFLRDNQLPYPVTYPLDAVDSVESYPVVIKSRTGSGSAQVTVVRDEAGLTSFQGAKNEYIVQEFLDGERGEYTCGLFRSRSGVTRSIILKRELLGGFTGYAEVVHNNAITDLLTAIAGKLNLCGSINVQLRLTDKGPVVFEINPRFSSTVRFRDLLGFKDVRWSLEDSLNLPLSDYTETSIGKKIYKGFDEYIQ